MSTATGLDGVRTRVPASAAFRFANVFLIAYALDAATSLVAFGLFASSDAGVIALLQHQLASVVLFLAFASLPVLAIAARLPVLPLSSLSSSVFWLGTGAAPLPLFFEMPSELSGGLALIQSAIVSLVFLRNRHRNAQRKGHTGWLFQEAAQPGASFSIAHTLRYMTACVLILIPLAFTYAFLSAATWLEIGTERFVQVNFSGIQLSDRLYVRDDREIRLVAMMHLGEDETYYDLAKSFIGSDTVVLEEGVSDESSTLESAISYDGVACALGLRAQRSIAEYLEGDLESEIDALWPVLRNADVDASAFSDSTIEYLGLASDVWAADDVLVAFMDVYQYGLDNPDIVKLFVSEVIDLRNRNLVWEIDRALPEFGRIIVPWGALHMPEIEREILERGFTLQDRTTRQIAGWATIATALAGP